MKANHTIRDKLSSCFFLRLLFYIFLLFFFLWKKTKCHDAQIIKATEVCTSIAYAAADHWTERTREKEGTIRERNDVADDQCTVGRERKRAPSEVTYVHA